MTTSRPTLEDLVPGGIKPTDHLHVETNDGTCSRCGERPPVGDAPLMLWLRGGHDLYIFCFACLMAEPSAAPERAPRDCC